VPEKRQELTTEGGLDVKANTDKIKDAATKLKSEKIEVSLFIDPEISQVDASRQAGADAIELHTGSYANSTGTQRDEELGKLITVAQRGLQNGLKVNAGHGLNYENVFAVRDIEGISDLNIGYSIVCRSVFVGLKTAVREMKELLR
jgi:pyridoxine 5-phosphate synthase